MTTYEHAATSQDAADRAAGSLYSGMDVWRSFALNLPVAITVEAMGFVGRRLQADAEHLSKLGACRSVEDYMKLQSNFVTKAMSDYQAEAAAVAKGVQEAVYQVAA